MNNQQKINDWLTNNQSYLKDKFARMLEDRIDLLTNTEVIFHELINEQFNYFIKLDIQNELGSYLAISPEDAMIGIESLNVKDYLNV